MNDLITINIETLTQAINYTLDNQLTPFVQSAPGVGKSTIIYDIAKDRNLKLISVVLTNYQCEDFTGLPFRSPITNKAEFLPFDLFPTEGDTIPDGYDGWLIFIDELASAKSLVQTSAQMLILERKVGNKKLHPAVQIVCAGNRVQDNANAIKLSTALKSRLVTFNLEVDPQEWITWAIKNDIDERIIAFIAFNPKNLIIFDPEDTEDSSFPAPRTWHFCSKLIKDIPDLNDVGFLIQGTLGTKIVPEFQVFAKFFLSLPKIEDIIKDPLNTKIPHRKEQQYAIIIAMTTKTDKNNIDDLLDYVSRFEPEFQIIFGKHLNIINPELLHVSKKCREFVISLMGN